MEIPYKVKLWKHQIDAISKATKEGVKEFALFNEVGTGKTASILNVLRHKCYEHRKRLKTIIICPVVVCENWKREFKIHSEMSDNVCVLKGSEKKRLELFNNPKKDTHVFVTNFEALQMKDLFSAIKNWCPEVVIVDEMHRIKNYKSLRTKALTVLGDQAIYRYGLTGTPILNSALDIYSQFRFLDRGETFGDNFFTFRAKYFYDKNAGMPAMKYFPDWRPYPNTLEAFNALIYKKAVRVLKKDCLDLPPFLKKRIDVDMQGPQLKAYLEMKQDFIAYIGDKACVATIALTKALRMQQIISGFFVSDKGEVVKFEDNSRLNALKGVIENISPTEKFIVWACFREDYDLISNLLDSMKIKHTKLVGGMTDKDRNESIDNFEKDDVTRCMIANQAAGGLGINMIAASVAIYYSRNFSLENDIQSEARNYRGGSERHKSVTRIDIVASGTIDDVILEALARKENLGNKILQIGKMI